MAASLSLRVLGAQILTGAVTYDSGLVGIYLPELDGNYYKFSLSALADLPTPDEISQYFDLALSMLTEDDIVRSADDETETLTCRPAALADFYLTWTVTELNGELSAIEAKIPDFSGKIEFSQKSKENSEKPSENVTEKSDGDFSVFLNSEKVSVNGVFTTRKPPENPPEIPQKTPVFVEDSEVFDLFDRLLGGVLDVL